MHTDCNYITHLSYPVSGLVFSAGDWELDRWIAWWVTLLPTAHHNTPQHTTTHHDAPIHVIETDSLVTSHWIGSTLYSTRFADYLCLSSCSGDVLTSRFFDLHYYTLFFIKIVVPKVVGNPSSYSGGLGFKYWSGTTLSGLRLKVHRSLQPNSR
jgi:hypothetical protein